MKENLKVVFKNSLNTSILDKDFYLAIFYHIADLKKTEQK